MNEKTITFADKVTIRPDCGQSWEWKSKDQAFYHSKELAPRKRCQACIDRRKRTITRVEVRDGE